MRFQIEIRDEGVGISKEDQARLFVDFLKLEQYENLNTEGTGLGLSICKRIIEEMGGNVHVVSQLGQGTSFIVTICTTMVGDDELFNKIYRRQQMMSPVLKEFSGKKDSVISQE